ncbi:MAG TPA: 4-(cytidine 5'-diphospho)-2-C-methyl-D-erythritol kinase [Rhodospirillaceae bacterium]|nr:4-(cytidine 5'-diphospho)-2-C-methyl-D-erythritol kinase [Rhodospirillaceae bacterium]
MSTVSPSLTALAPAKVNLSLRITGRRADGYHLLDSLVAFTDFGDRIDVSAADRLTLTVQGPFADVVPRDESNLVIKAAQRLAQAAGIEAQAHITLTKTLPAAGGIGGGSSDAATVLRLLIQHWALTLPAQDLNRLALALGADVPVCLINKPCRMTGIGENLSPLPPLPPVGIVLINPGHPCETPAVFRARSGPFSAPALAFNPGMTAHSLAEALQQDPNDLTEAALQICPSIRQVLDHLAGSPGILLSRMSGSGATCFGLYDSPDQAQKAASDLAHPGWWVAAGSLTG